MKILKLITLTSTVLFVIYSLYVKLVLDGSSKSNSPNLEANSSRPSDVISDDELNEIIQRNEILEKKRENERAIQAAKFEESHTAPISLELEQESLEASVSGWVVIINQKEFRKFTLHCKTSGTQKPAYQAVELLSENELDEVLLSCERPSDQKFHHQIAFFNPTTNKWEIREILNDSTLHPLASIEKDGQFIFYSTDTRFIGAFSAPKHSSEMKRFWKFTTSGLFEITKLPDGLPYLKQEKTRLDRELQDFLMSPNGFFPAYVAVKTLLGEKTDAWYKMLKGYNESSTIGLSESKCLSDLVNDCPNNTNHKKTYPEALKKFLEEAGYL